MAARGELFADRPNSTVVAFDRANIAESWSKRRYPAHFKSKLTDADGELQETLHWLDTAKACGYLKEAQCADLQSVAESTGKQLGSMINQHESFCF